MGRKAEDITGKKFGIFTVLKRVENPNKTKSRHSYWLCVCECKNQKVFLKGNLINGYAKCNNCNKSNKVKDEVRLRNIWNKIIKRCEDKEDKDYGGRGIKIVSDWMTFDNFYNDMIDAYKECMDSYGNATIERIDVNGNYCKLNCKWATTFEQNRNKRSTIKSVIYGEEYITLTDISLRFNIDYTTLQDRYSRGYRNEELIKDVRVQKKKSRGELDLNIDDKIYKNFNEVHRDYPYLNRQTIIDRYDKGLRGEYLVKDKFFYMNEDGTDIINSIRET